MSWMITPLILLSCLLSSCGEDPTTGNTEKSPSININQSPVGPQSEAGSEVQKTLQIPEELKADFDLLNEEYVVYGGGPVEGIDNLKIVYSLDESIPYENIARGYCDKSGDTPLITLYKYDWVHVLTRDLRRSVLQRRRSLYHLIGHCVFNLPHNDETMRTSFGSVYYDYPKSLMHSNWEGGMVPGQVLEYWTSNTIDLFWREIKQR